MAPKKKEANPKSRAWCFTLFVDEKTPFEVKELPKGINYMVWQMEQCPKTEKIHIQGYTEMSSPVSLKKAKTLIGDKAHLEVRNGTQEQAIAYCMKAESRVAGPWELGNKAPGRGARTDLKQVADLIKEGKSIGEIFEECPETYMKYHKGIEKGKFLFDKKNMDKHEEKDVIVFWGESRTGKSRKAREIAGKSPYLKPDGTWYDGYDGENVAIFDDFDWKAMPIGQLLKALDNYPSIQAIKGGHIVWKPKVVIITSNEDPKTWYPSADERQRIALWKRFKSVEFFGTTLISGTPAAEPTIKTFGEHLCGNQVGGNTVPHL